MTTVLRVRTCNEELPPPRPVQSLWCPPFPLCGTAHTAWWQCALDATAQGTHKGLNSASPKLMVTAAKDVPKTFWSVPLRACKWISPCYSKLHTDFIQCTSALVLQVPVNFLSLYLNIFHVCSFWREKKIEKGKTGTVHFLMFRFMLQSNHSPISIKVIRNII